MGDIKLPLTEPAYIELGEFAEAVEQHVKKVRSFGDSMTTNYAKDLITQYCQAMENAEYIATKCTRKDRKTAEWQPTKLPTTYTCGDCGATSFATPYCANCGASMKR